MQYMIPLIILADCASAQEKYISELVVQHGVNQHHVFHIFPEKTELTIDQVRSIQKLVITAPVSVRIIICHAFDTSSHEVQNALLKTLEEKSVSNQFILLGSNIARILPTIRSRSKIITFTETDKKKKPVSSLILEVEKAENYSYLAHPDLKKVTKSQALTIIEDYIAYLRKQLISGKLNLSPLITLCIDRREKLQSNNLNPQLAVDTLFIVSKRFFKKATA